MKRQRKKLLYVSIFLVVFGVFIIVARIVPMGLWIYNPYPNVATVTPMNGSLSVYFGHFGGQLYFYNNQSIYIFGILNVSGGGSPHFSSMSFKAGLTS
jgi:hypothetical protein